MRLVALPLATEPERLEELLDAVLCGAPTLEAGVVLEPHDNGAVHGTHVDLGSLKGIICLFVSILCPNQ